MSEMPPMKWVDHPEPTRCNRPAQVLFVGNNPILLIYPTRNWRWFTRIEDVWITNFKEMPPLLQELSERGGDPVTTNEASLKQYWESYVTKWWARFFEECRR